MTKKLSKELFTHTGLVYHQRTIKEMYHIHKDDSKVWNLESFPYRMQEQEKEMSHTLVGTTDLDPKQFKDLCFNVMKNSRFETEDDIHGCSLWCEEVILKVNPHMIKIDGQSNETPTFAKIYKIRYISGSPEILNPFPPKTTKKDRNCSII